MPQRVPFTEPVRGRNVVSLLHLAVLFERYEHRLEVHCYSTFKSALEAATELSQREAGMDQGCDITDGTPKNHRPMSNGRKHLI